MWETEQFWGTIDFHSIFFPTMEVNGAPKQPGYKLSSKYLPLCSAEQRHSYRFGTTWGRVNDGRIFIFGWTIPLNNSVSRFLVETSSPTLQRNFHQSENRNNQIAPKSHQAVAHRYLQNSGSVINKAILLDLFSVTISRCKLLSSLLLKHHKGSFCYCISVTFLG